MYRLFIQNKENISICDNLSVFILTMKIRFQCNHCDKTFARKNVLRRHVETVHDSLELDENQIHEKTEKVEKVDNAEPEEESVIEPEVDLEEESMTENDPIKEEVEVKTEIDVKTDTDGSPEEKSLNLILSKEVYCAICEKKFPLKRNLKKHFVKNHGNEIWNPKIHVKRDNTCKVCGKNFKVEESLNNHFVKIHF